MFIPVNEPLLDGNEKKYLNECIDTGWIADGRFVKEFEQGMANYVGRKHGIAVCNGTAALELALESLNLQKNDEVILSTFSIISCILPLIRRGIKPVLVDVKIDSWNMDTNIIEEKITKRTKAILVVHTYGLPVEMENIYKIAQKYGLKIIEDAAEAHGLTYKGKACGSFGDVSIMSFYQNKLITTGEGGIILTDDDIIALKCQSYRNLCFLPDKRFYHNELGFNYRLSNLQAAVGIAQLEKINSHINIKRNIGYTYTKLLKDCPYIQIPLEKIDGAQNIYWIYGIVLSKTLEIAARDIMLLLKNVGIGTRPFFYPMHLQPVFQKMGLFCNETYPIAEYLANKGFYIPSGLNLKEKQIEYVSTQLLTILENI